MTLLWWHGCGDRLCWFGVDVVVVGFSSMKANLESFWSILFLLDHSKSSVLYSTTLRILDVVVVGCYSSRVAIDDDWAIVVESGELSQSNRLVVLTVVV